MPLLLPGNVLNNILKGKLGVASGWGTAPTNLENATDGNVDTVTGEGSTVLAAAGYYGNVTFDLGIRKNVMVSAWVGTRSTAGTISVYLAHSPDNTTWYQNYYGMAQTLNTPEQITSPNMQFVSDRYIRLRFYVNAACTAYARLYEVAAWELVI